MGCWECSGYFFGLELVTFSLALHKDFGLVIAFCDHVIFCNCVFCSEELSGGRELPHIAEFWEVYIDSFVNSLKKLIKKRNTFTERSFLVCCYFGNCLSSMLQIISLTRGSMHGNRSLSAFCRRFSWWRVRNLRLWCHRHDSRYSVRWLRTSWGLSSWVCSWRLIC